MDNKIPVLCVIIAIATILAGCTTVFPGNETAVSQPPETTLPGAAPSGTPAGTSDEDCVPAQCCHPTSCVNRAAQPACGDVMCTTICEGPLDCGAGRCGYVAGTCGVIPASPSPTSGSSDGLLALESTPDRYSPFMSSTVGIGITPHLAGVNMSETRFTWNASYGTFLSWAPPDYKVVDRGNPVENPGEKLYWSFSETPPVTTDPVRIVVTATDIADGTILGTSTLTLGWDGNFAVIV